MTRIHIESDHKPAVAALVENSLAMQEKAVRAGLKRTKLRLKAFEKEFGQSSQQFYQSYQAGKMGDDEAYMEWAGEWETHLELTQALALLRETTEFIEQSR